MGKRMDINEIVQLIERFDTSKATKLQLKSGDMELTLESASLQNVYVPQPDTGKISQQVSINAENEKQQPASGKSNKFTGGDVEVTESEIKGIPIKAPLVGTFYCAPSPEEKPFVSAGKSVKKGDVIGIIEAMKLMNEITAPEDGVVKTILAENGNMVEYGEVLMVLE